MELGLQGDLVLVMGAVSSKVSGWGMDGYGAQAGLPQFSAQPNQDRDSLHLQSLSTTTVGGC